MSEGLYDPLVSWQAPPLCMLRCAHQLYRRLAETRAKNVMAMLGLERCKGEGHTKSLLSPSAFSKL